MNQGRRVSSAREVSSVGSCEAISAPADWLPLGAAAEGGDWLWERMRPPPTRLEVASHLAAFRINRLFLWVPGVSATPAPPARKSDNRRLGTPREKPRTKNEEPRTNHQFPILTLAIPAGVSGTMKLTPLIRSRVAVAATFVAAGRAAAAFYGDPPDATHPWAIHDENRPQPPRVEPGTFSPGRPA